MRRAKYVSLMTAVLGICCAFAKTVEKEGNEIWLRAILRDDDRYYVFDANPQSPFFDPVLVNPEDKESVYVCEAGDESELCTIEIDENELGQVLYDGATGSFYYNVQYVKEANTGYTFVLL